MRVGFIGLGNMGAHMAMRLLNVGHELFVFDLNSIAVQDMVAQGARALTALEECSEQQLDAVLTMLPSAVQVQDVYLGSKGLIASLEGQKCILIDCSTIDPYSAQKVASFAQNNNLPMLDAPVSGGTVGAKEGTLTFMVGGSSEVIKLAEPLFKAMGKNIIHCGDCGHGQAAKIANNLLLGITMVGVAEAMSLGIKLGVNPQVLAQVINHSSGRCWSSEINNPVPGISPHAPANREYQGGFASGLMQKDLRLALQAAQKADHSIFMGALAEQLYQHFNQRQGSQIDFSAIIQLYQRD